MNFDGLALADNHRSANTTDTGMNAYLTYWKPERVRWEEPSRDLLDHAASNQFGKLQRGDRVYILTFREGTPWLVGALSVDAVLGQTEAARRLGVRPQDLWEAKYHLLPPAGTAIPVTPVRCEAALKKVEVMSDGQTTKLSLPLSGQHFQTMRQITPKSASHLEKLLKSRPSLRSSNRTLTRNRIFDALGAKVTNPRWSWCALSANRSAAIFTIWHDEVSNGRSRLSWPEAEKRGGPGGKEKRRILEMAIRENLSVYGLLCFAADTSVSPRSIKRVNGEYLVRLQIESDGGSIFGRHIGHVFLHDAIHEISGKPVNPFDGLQDLAEIPEGTLAPDRAAVTGKRFIRDAKVREYVLRLAKGCCEFCGEPGFKMRDGREYLETHHIIALSAAGKDTIDNVIGLCAMHHREAHFGAEAEALERKFIECVKARNLTLSRVAKP